MQSFKIENPSPSMQSAHALIGNQIHSLLTLFITRETSLVQAKSSTKAPSWEASQQTRVIKLVLELVANLEAMADEHLMLLSWLVPMLESILETKNETIRQNVSKLLERFQDPSTPEAEAEPVKRTASI